MAIAPDRLVAMIQRLGPIYVKIGQFLSVRPDILPQEYCNALLALTDQADPVGWEDIRAAFQAGTGRDIETGFAHVERQPLAAGSLAQVHRARTASGRIVAIKVQRLGIAERVRRSTPGMRRLLRTLEALGLLSGIDARELGDEIARWLAEELDFTRECRNTQRMWELTAASDIVRVPRPLSAASSATVLVQEYLPGLPFSEILRLVRAGNDSPLARMGVDRARLAANLILATYTQIFRYRFFHADPHAGNLLALPDGAIGLVDFGLVDVLPDARRNSQTAFIAAAYAGDVPALYRELRRTLNAARDADEDALHAGFVALTDAWLSTRMRTSGREASIGPYLVSVMRLIRRTGFRLPGDLLALYRALLTAETIAAEIAPGVDLISVGRQFFAAEQIDALVAQISPARLQTAAFDAASLALDGPGRVARLLAEIDEDRFVLRVRTEDAQEDRRLANARARLVAVAIVAIVPAMVMGLFVIARRDDLAWAAAATLVLILLLEFRLWRSLR